ncbi:MAG: hypothetical protein L6Q99_22395 [Planctomycetes bacterium]|nr:hypothetical protein [Planctomycetota bacterium]
MSAPEELPPHGRAPDRSGRRWPKLVLLQLVVWPLAIVLGELGLRGVRAVFGDGYSADAVRTALGDLQARNREFTPKTGGDLPWNPAESERAERVAHPYVGYEALGGLEVLEDQRADFRTTSTHREFRLAIFGGSVAEIFAQSGEATLRRVLGADPRFRGVDVRILGFGRGGYRQPQHQAFLAYLFALGLEPDAVLCLDGFNEVALGRQNARFGTHASFPSIPHWSQLVARGAEQPEAIAIAARIRGTQAELEEFTTWALDRELARSAWLGEWAVRRAAALRRETLEASDAYTQVLRANESRLALGGPMIRGDLELPVQTSVAIWKEASRNMRAMCTARHVPYLHVLQPTLHDDGAKPIHPEEVEKGAIDTDWLEGVRTGYPLLRAAGAELEQEGERFVDASRIFANVAEPLYLDSCHFGQRGNELLAEEIAARLLEVLP